MSKLDPKVREFLKKIGSMKSAKKRAAVTENLKKARKARWPKKGAI